MLLVVIKFVPEKMSEHQQTDRQTDRQADRQTDRQTDGPTDRQRQRDGPTDRHTEKEGYPKPYARADISGVSPLTDDTVTSAPNSSSFTLCARKKYIYIYIYI